MARTLLKYLCAFQGEENAAKISKNLNNNYASKIQKHTLHEWAIKKIGTWNDFMNEKLSFKTITTLQMI